VYFFRKNRCRLQLDNKKYHDKKSIYKIHLPSCWNGTRMLCVITFVHMNNKNYMKFRGFIVAIICSILFPLILSSCTSNEDYIFKFKIIHHSKDTTITKATLLLDSGKTLTIDCINERNFTTDLKYRYKVILFDSNTNEIVSSDLGGSDEPGFTITGSGISEIFETKIPKTANYNIEIKSTTFGDFSNMTFEYIGNIK
jgi:hypothetical protein